MSLCAAIFAGGAWFAPQLPTSFSAIKSEPGLLFYLSGNYGFKADYSKAGNPEPNFLGNVRIIPDGAKGPGFECAHNQLMSYWAPGNIFAERGTLSFFWRSREPVGQTEFPIFRVGYADHSSWDMVWLRIDYNGHGFDAFVTDTGLARTRVSYALSPFPPPNEWIHLALAWDETVGLRFYVNGKLAAKKNQAAILYSGLDQFGPHSRIIAPWQVQSAYNFVRGGDIDEIRIYDRMLAAENMSRLAKGESAGEVPPLIRNLGDARWQAEWWLRHGWNRKNDIPPYLDQPQVRVRKIEIRDAYDLKRWYWKGTDGIRETTWPGVYNRSRLPGRNDYFQLPDWDCYSLSGKVVTFSLPDEYWNHLEISGPAWGGMSLVSSDRAESSEKKGSLFQRPKGQEKTSHRLKKPIFGQQLAFTNVEQETPISELAAYYVEGGKEPVGIRTLRYKLTRDADPPEELLKPLVSFIAGRHAPDEQALMIARPEPLPVSPKSKKADSSGLPLVHILIPCDLRKTQQAGLDPAYQWENIDGGLDGIAVDLPPLEVKATHGKYFPMNIQIKDPIWPMRNALDFTFSVKPREARTLWLDIRDRILPPGKSLYLTIAGAGADFGSATLEGMQIRLIFKPWKEAYREHVQDRFTQLRDNYAHLLEERPRDKRFNLYNRLEAELTDLLRVDPQHYPGQNYAYDIDPKRPKPRFIQPAAPAGVPLWAFRQVEDLRYFKRFVLWWIQHRQIENGEFGGGLSDDDDLTNCWPGAVLMGCDPERITDSVLRELDAIYAQGMFTNGLATIQTDGLHAHEEGIEAQTQAMLIDYGNPKQVERMMETVRALDERIILHNRAGHRHFRSNYFSGTKISTEGVWEWPQAQVYLLMQPVLTIAEFNGNPRARRLAIDVADGLLAHARRDESGRLVIDTEINFSTDAARPSVLGSKSILASGMGSGAVLSTASAALQLLWAVYRHTGERKYLQPLLDLGEGVLGSICENALDIARLRDSFGRKIVESTLPTDSNDFFRHIAWQMTGNKAYLEKYYADQIEASALREYINTQGYPWSDRAYAANRELQRSRLGGIGLVRGAIFSGHAVSWKFLSPANDESLAILVPESTPSSIKIIVYALEQRPVETIMTAWAVEPGKWEITQGIDETGDDHADTNLMRQAVNLERSKEVRFSFPPRKTTIVTLRLLDKSIPYWQRPDLGISQEDIRREGNTITVRVHSLGAVAAPATTLALYENHNLIAQALIPAIEAPLDLSPKAAPVKITMPAGTNVGNCSLQIDPENKLLEITRLNNRIDLKDTTVMPKTTTEKKTDDTATKPFRKPQLERLILNVADPAAIADWYCNHLGMKVVRISPPPANVREIVFPGGNFAIELYTDASVAIPNYAAFAPLSLHLAFMVDDVKKMRDALIPAGARLEEDVTTIPSGDQLLMLRDPWGLPIQFAKRTTPMLEFSGMRTEHLGINVQDPVSLTNWHFENLGMKVMRQGPSPIFTSFFSDAGGNMMLEVYHNSAHPLLNLSAFHPQSLRIAFAVDDIRTVRNGLIAAGANLVEDIKTTSTGNQVLVLQDPWGIPMQFIEK